VADESWDMKQAEWRGYVVRALEDINKDMIDLKTSIKESDTRLEKRIDALNARCDCLDKKINSVQIKMAGIASLSAVLITLVLKVVFNV
jgi:hypothetical protein